MIARTKYNFVARVSLEEIGSRRMRLVRRCRSRRSYSTFSTRLTRARKAKGTGQAVNSSLIPDREFNRHLRMFRILRWHRVLASGDDYSLPSTTAQRALSGQPGIEEAVGRSEYNPATILPVIKKTFGIPHFEGQFVPRSGHLKIVDENDGRKYRQSGVRDEDATAPGQVVNASQFDIHLLESQLLARGCDLEKLSMVADLNAHRMQLCDSADVCLGLSFRKIAQLGSDRKFLHNVHLLHDWRVSHLRNLFAIWAVGLCVLLRQSKTQCLLVHALAGGSFENDTLT